MLALFRAQQACRQHTHAARGVARGLPALRQLHATPTAMKKKSSKSDDLFGDDDALFGDAGELFGAEPATAAEGTSATSEAATSTTPKSGKKLSPEERLARFNALLKFVDDRIGLHPPAKAAGKPEQVRNTAWQHLFSLAKTKEQLEQVVAIFPKWREARREFTPRAAAAFVRRCEELRCPTLALQVFGDHTKYGLDLPHIGAARQLLHALHVEHPLSDSVTLSALHGLYGLPAVAEDLVSCAMLTSACFKANTTASRTLAHALVPALRGLLAHAQPAHWKYPTKPYPRNKRKDRVWLTWTLTKIEKALKAQKAPHEWLSEWREKTGHAKLAT